MKAEGRAKLACAYPRCILYSMNKDDIHYLDMRLKKLIFFASAFCFVLSIGCVSGQKESTVLSDQGKAISESEKLEDYINSLDIHMELKDSVFTGRVDMIEYDIINNSDLIICP
ncbi:hypothetical protein [Proteiniphilum acetatigenes]|uniref:hypothetical protein n=1 Tax=Proteiniphilum acetatigenes TaxID=294710 RepID=UPI000377C0E4|nr:hypothetical protein [Proteiniphilum acetatigenes]SFK49676.1 hypothetical protein SAMN05216357_102394 [Porphyromonadaceae bacterium KH3CP3RA]